MSSDEKEVIMDRAEFKRRSEVKIAWLKSPEGQAAIGQALTEARERTNRIREASVVESRVLNEPVTI